MLASFQAYKLVPPEEGSGLTFSFNTSQDAAEEAFAQVEAETEAANPPPAPEASAPEVAPTGGPPAAPPAPAAAVPPAPPAPTEEDPLKDAFKVHTETNNTEKKYTNSFVLLSLRKETTESSLFDATATPFSWTC